MATSKGIEAMRKIDPARRAEAASKAAETNRRRNAAEREERRELIRDREQALAIARSIRDRDDSSDSNKLTAIRLIMDLTTPRDNPPQTVYLVDSGSIPARAD